LAAYLNPSDLELGKPLVNFKLKPIGLDQLWGESKQDEIQNDILVSPLKYRKVSFLMTNLMKSMMTHFQKKRIQLFQDWLPVM